MRYRLWTANVDAWTDNRTIHYSLEMQDSELRAYLQSRRPTLIVTSREYP
jgi:hypothetical protein